MELKDSDYVFYKLINSVIFNVKQELYSRKNNKFLYGLNSLKCLKNIMHYYADNNLLTDLIVKNVYDYLSEAREFKDEHYDERVNIINDIIVLLNSCDIKDDNKIYHEEYVKRGSIDSVIYKYSSYDEESIADSIAFDCLVLISHSKQTSNEKFKKSYLPFLIGKIEYYQSLSAIYKEHPQIFMDELFQDRMIYVLRKNDVISYSDYRFNKGIVKKIDKKIRNI